MKTKGLYALTPGGSYEGSIYQKMFVVSLIIALLFAALPVDSVFAAPARDQDPAENGNFKLGWKNKIRNVHAQSLFYDQVRLFPADFEDPADLARAHELLNKYGFALRQANAIISTHAGFDIKGNVTNEEQAAQSVRDLAENLRIMRGMRLKLEEEGYNIRRSR